MIAGGAECGAEADEGGLSVRTDISQVPPRVNISSRPEGGAFHNRGKIIPQKKGRWQRVIRVKMGKFAIPWFAFGRPVSGLSR